MLAKLSVDQALKKARSYVKKNEVTEAQKLYEAVLHAFPKNKRAQQALAGLKRPKQKFITQSVHIKAIDQLINIYNQGQFKNFSYYVQWIISPFDWYDNCNLHYL